MLLRTPLHPQLKSRPNRSGRARASG